MKITDPNSEAVAAVQGPGVVRSREVHSAGPLPLCLFPPGANTDLSLGCSLLRSQCSRDRSWRGERDALFRNPGTWEDGRLASPKPTPRCQSEGRSFQRKASRTCRRLRAEHMEPLASWRQSDRSQSRCAIKDAESVMGVGLCRGADSLQPPPIWQMSPQCPLLTPASKAAPLGFPNVPRALVSFSLLPSCRTPLFLLGHWGSLGVPGPSWDGAWAEHTLGAHTVPAAVCVGAGYGHPTAWELYLWDTGSQDPPDSGSPSPCLGFLQEANPRKARLSTPATAQASRAIS